MRASSLRFHGFCHPKPILRPKLASCARISAWAVKNQTGRRRGHSDTWPSDPGEFWGAAEILGASGAPRGRRHCDSKISECRVGCGIDRA